MEKSIQSSKSYYDRLPKSLTTVTTFSKLLALFLFILLPFAGFMIGAKYQAKLDSLKSETINNAPTPTPTADPTANRKTFLSKSGKFSVKYPKEWSVVNTGDTPPFAEDVSFGPNVKYVTEDLNTRVWINVQKNHTQNGTAPLPSAKALIDAFSKEAQSNPAVLSTEINPVTVDGTSGFTLSISYKNGRKGLDATLDKNDFVYIISGTDSKDVETMLSTFKFTNQIASPTSAQKISCTSNTDCQNGETCQVWGPIVVKGLPNKFCTAPGQAVPL